LRVFSCTAAKPPCKKILLFFPPWFPMASLIPEFFNTLNLKGVDRCWGMFYNKVEFSAGKPVRKSWTLLSLAK